MVYDIYSWDKRLILERINLAIDRISQIKSEKDIRFGEFFLKLSGFLEQVNDLRIKKDSGEFDNQSF